MLMSDVPVERPIVSSWVCIFVSVAVCDCDECNVGWCGMEVRCGGVGKDCVVKGGCVGMCDRDSDV